MTDEALAGPALETRGLGKTFGDFQAVESLDLSVAPGEVFAFLGPNGAGKTTTIRMLMGILVPSAGRAFIHGLDCFTERVEVKRRVGFLPDDPVFYDYLTGRELIQFVGEMHGLGSSRIQERAVPLVERFGLQNDLNEYAVNYSRGMKKKLGMICALLHEPSLLILDEPTSGLDPGASRLLTDLVRERAAAGTSVFFSTHLLDQAERLCSRVAILHQGRKVADGPLDELRASLVRGGSLEEVFFAVTAPEPAPDAEESTDEAGPDGAHLVPAVPAGESLEGRRLPSEDDAPDTDQVVREASPPSTEPSGEECPGRAPASGEAPDPS